MDWQFTYYVIPSLVTVLLSTVLITLVFRHRSDPLAARFITLTAILGAWAAAYAIQLGYPNLERQLFWYRVTLTIGGTVPTLWLLLTIEYADLSDWLSRPVLALLAVDPTVIAVMAWTNYRGLIWREASLDWSPTTPGPDLTFGSGFFVHIAYAYLLVVAGIVLLLWVSRSSRLRRRQALTLTVGAAVPLSANVAFTLGLSPISSVDLTPFTFVLTLSVFALVLFRLDLLERTPIALETIIDEAGDGYLVLDTDGSVVEASPEMGRIASTTPVEGRDIEPVLGATPEDLDGTVVSATTDEGTRRYAVRTAELSDHRGNEVGHAIALRDVTDLEAHRQRLQVVNRILRHNLRNRMTAVLAHADQLEAAVDAPAVESARRIREIALDVGELGENAKHIEGTARQVGGQPETVDATEVVEEAAADARETYDDARITATGPEAAWVSVLGGGVFETTVGHLVENAIEHNDAPEPTVEVTVEADPETVRIEVADDGPGIPEMEREVLLTGDETSLHHGSGLGLWLVYWSVTESGGTLRFEENDPHGSVVIIELPRAEPTPEEGGLASKTAAASGED